MPTNKKGGRKPSAKSNARTEEEILEDFLKKQEDLHERMTKVERDLHDVVKFLDPVLSGSSPPFDGAQIATKKYVDDAAQNLAMGVHRRLDKAGAPKDRGPEVSSAATIERHVEPANEGEQGASEKKMATTLLAILQLMDASDMGASFVIKRSVLNRGAQWHLTITVAGAHYTTMEPDLHVAVRSLYTIVGKQRQLPDLG